MTRWRRSRAGDRGGGLGGLRFRLLLRFAAFAVFWERLWPRLWPAACLVGGFVALGLLDVLPRLPGWLHAAVLGLFALGLVGALAWARPAFREVGRAAAHRRLERDSDVHGRPLQALEDDIAAGRDDLLAEALWRRHRQRMAALVRSLRLRLPDTGLARHEPWGVRAGVLLLLAIGLAAGHGDAGARLSRALDLGLRAGGSAAGVEVWITPPAYTGAVPIYLRIAPPRPGAEASGSTGASTGASAAEDPAPVPRVPVGSSVLARATGTPRAPLLIAGSSRTPFASLGTTDGETSWRAETTIAEGDRIVVQAGRRDLAAWPVAVVADSPPDAAFAEPPAAAGNGLLGVAWRAEDDYGVTGLSLAIEPVGGAGGEALHVPLPPNSLAAKTVSGRTQLDLSAQPLAGQPVRIRLQAADGAQQTGSSPPVELVLPERTFSHPVAQRLVALRRTLFVASPEVAQAVAFELDDIAARPEAFARDTVVSLALAVSRARLRLDDSASAAGSVRDLLWQTALRLEQGDVPLAERQLAEARQRLADALQSGAPQADIDRLMDELQQALDRYLAAAAKELTQRGALLDAPLDPQAGALGSDDLHEMLETARDLARVGNRESAMQMLADLDRALDGMRSAMRGETQRQMAEAQAMMQALRELGERQQKLLDETFQRLREQSPGAERRNRPGSPGLRERSASAPPPAGANPARSADKAGIARQQALRRDLGELTSRLDDLLGSIPSPLSSADQAMRRAVDALGQQRLDDATNDQGRAVEALQQALQAAGKAMSERMGGGIALGRGPGGSGDLFGRQPAGRRGFATGSAKIPDRGSPQRAQEIRDELRRRAAERSRPQNELEYIDRLLRPF